MSDWNVVPPRRFNSAGLPRPGEDRPVETDTIFFARRAEEEAAKAAVTDDAAVRSIHVELSHRYAEASRRAAAGITPRVPGSLLDP